jgi:hypothetical protein
MSNHFGDTNKMVSDTPRTDAVWELFATDTTLEPDVEFSTLARQLERELNAANQRIKRLEEAGSLALGYAAKGDLESADEVWDKAKEAKL